MNLSISQGSIFAYGISERLKLLEGPENPNLKRLLPTDHSAWQQPFVTD